jgi:osmotically-inducible protein OsmY
MPKRPPQSYDEISRRTVANPDLSFRPSQEEEQLSRHRFGAETEHRPHVLDARERVLLDRVRTAVFEDPNLDLTDVTIDIDDDEVVLIGTVPGPATALRIQEIAGAVHGIRRVDNQLIARGRTP